MVDYTKVRPLSDHMLVRRKDAESRTKGGIIISDNAKERPIEGEVLAVGPGRVDDKGVRRPLPVKAGDVILFGKYSGTQLAGLQAREVEYLMIREDDVLAVVEP